MKKYKESLGIPLLILSITNYVLAYDTQVQYKYCQDRRVFAWKNKEKTNKIASFDS